MTSNDQLTDELGRELHRRADDLHGAPLTFDDVRGRARAIRRRRRAAAAAAAVGRRRGVVAPCRRCSPAAWTAPTDRSRRRRRPDAERPHRCCTTAR